VKRENCMNIKEFLRYATDILKAAKIETPVLEAGVVLCFVLKCDRTYLYSHDDRVLQKAEIEALNDMLGQRANNVPLQYLVGETEFMSLSFVVSPAVLIPRQDTEILVERCIKLVTGMSIPRQEQIAVQNANAKYNAGASINANAKYNTGASISASAKYDTGANAKNNINPNTSVNGNINPNANANDNDKRDEITADGKVKVLDMCTGSGCVAISIAHYCPDSIVVACDVSRDALCIAKANSERNRVQNRLKLRWGDLFEALDGERGFDIIVSNPPYIETSIMPELQKEVRDHEPHLALDGGNDGLDFYRKITAMAPSYLINGGYLAFEIGYNQGQSVKSLMQECFKDIEICKDISGNDRVVIGRFYK